MPYSTCYKAYYKAYYMTSHSRPFTFYMSDDDEWLLQATESADAAAAASALPVVGTNPFHVKSKSSKESPLSPPPGFGHSPPKDGLLPMTTRSSARERNRREVDPGAAGFETTENTHFTHQTAT